MYKSGSGTHTVYARHALPSFASSACVSYELDLHGEARSKVPEFDALWSSDALVEALSCCLKQLGSNVEPRRGHRPEASRYSATKGMADASSSNGEGAG
ncbi:unnamed protein product [Vitrella brassicaformis CCMP3155]|uniref:Uncharacterized protein n=1 Tax=Vitrella brassicaformis (strain CCMP3155) TaxID=1169540 RepID=A0A0G4EAX3_VITBC|nr:unnamed protein product [Vitrella brassicaformis CCMP3155]|eukprot:CEL92448.1 unnamed protein product [Vitrella brassicaformis CCMP3155]